MGQWREELKEQKCQTGEIADVLLELLGLKILQWWPQTCIVKHLRLSNVLLINGCVSIKPWWTAVFEGSYNVRA